MSNFLTNVRVFFIESEENRKLTNNIDETVAMGVR